jgi:hypothetical protein
MIFYISKANVFAAVEAEAETGRSGGGVGQ